MPIPYPANMPLITTNQEGVLQNHGDAIWNELCDTIHIGVKTKVVDAANTLDYLKDFAPQTRLNYLRVVIKAVLLDFKNRPEAYDGPCPITPNNGPRLKHFTL